MACTSAIPSPTGTGHAGLGGSGTVADGLANPTGEGDGHGSAAETVTLATGNPRASRGVVAEGGAGAPYNYTPTVMRDGDHTRMWWCSQYNTARPAGDDIVYGVADSGADHFTGPNGGIPLAVFSGSSSGFDAVHTCDPSVIRVDDRYYLYYTGADGDGDFANAIGLAKSEDGKNWRRVNGGEPIVRAAFDTERANTYGAGQPAVTYLEGRYYLMFTDTTGHAAGWNGAGQFVLRSPDPAFASDVEALGPDGFDPVTSPEETREHAVIDAFSVDLMWVAALDAFAVAHQTTAGTTVTFFDRDFATTPYEPVVIEGQWREGPGLLRDPKGHAPVSAREPCETVPLDVIRATRNTEAPTDLRRFGLDLVEVAACADAGIAMAVLDGYAVPAAGGDVVDGEMDVITDSEVVRVQRREVAELLADRVLDVRPGSLGPLRATARLEPGAPVLSSPNHRGGVVLDDDRMWPVAEDGIDELAERNGSPNRTVSDGEWQSYPEAPGFG
ncbi:family 43 glycosylhydrolase [Haloechinothrix sp. LS1_15]|nr:family 43 glycosylhydrolase [Haloechinothrix sp. LS1_15]